MTTQGKEKGDAVFKDFIKEYLKSGFGSLSKHDTELLIYHFMANKSNYLKEQSNHERASELKITESKHKTIMLESHIKYVKKPPNDIIKDIRVCNWLV